MNDKIKIAIAGYGNIGKGVEKAVIQNDDMILTAIFTRRNPQELKTLSNNSIVKHFDEAEKMKNEIDVVIICGGSATDLPEIGPHFAKMFNTIDSFDTHAKIPDYFQSMDNAAKSGGNISIISVGWDPGLFSINRIIGESVLPFGSSYTFWGKGVSQGHSDALRRIPGVKNAIQYTIPVKEAMEKAKSGLEPKLTTREKHIRECFVVAEENADKSLIEKTIKEMPNYFDEYDVTIHFITEEELKKEHNKMPHGGFVIRSGKTGENNHVMEFSLKLDSNPEFTASILAAYARAAFKLSQKGEAGAKTVFDIAPSLISQYDVETLRAKML